MAAAEDKRIDEGLRAPSGGVKKKAPTFKGPSDTGSAHAEQMVPRPPGGSARVVLIHNFLLGCLAPTQLYLVTPPPPRPSPHLLAESLQSHCSQSEANHGVFNRKCEPDSCDSATLLQLLPASCQQRAPSWRSGPANYCPGAARTCSDNRRLPEGSTSTHPGDGRASRGQAPGSLCAVFPLMDLTNRNGARSEKETRGAETQKKNPCGMQKLMFIGIS
ncbi:uncharacterized protein LOC133634267 [Entelurus aequoreus]|uniref:uncharacterized protein LOC133634267 n=1 Tax=Entelurus aequoreus TaxID=161455 RepID=UPI002B1DA491|nr:uncharacterized protein LOC133634267 [Entelurus aequoreus]